MIFTKFYIHFLKNNKISDVLWQNTSELFYNKKKILKVYFILSCLDHIQTSALPQKKITIKKCIFCFNFLNGSQAGACYYWGFATSGSYKEAFVKTKMIVLVSSYSGLL